MRVPELTPELNEHLDILGQQSILLKLYTQLTFCFPNTGSSNDEAVVQKLRRGLESLSEAFAWVAGQVVVNKATGDKDPQYKIRPYQRTPPFVIKDLRNDETMPSMTDLEQAQYPMSMLDEGVIAARTTLPTDFTSSEANPCFSVQATFIKGGLLLTFNGQHATMDMVGQGEVIHALSRKCRGESFTEEELRIGNMPRKDLVPLLHDSYKRGPELDYQIARPAPTNPPPSGTPDHPGPPTPSLMQPVTCTWAYFHFSSSSLTTIKSLATRSLPPNTPFISTDDALSAFLWQSIIRIRLPHLNLTSTQETTMTRAVDVRPYLSIPPTYPGLMQNLTYHTLPVTHLVNSPLGGVAALLRSKVDMHASTYSLAYDTRSLATYFARATPLERSKISFTATLDCSQDLMISSWSKLGAYINECDFGLGLGRPVAVRRPRFVGVEGLIYLMPRDREELGGGMAVAVCLSERDMDALRDDVEFGKLARYVG